MNDFLAGRIIEARCGFVEIYSRSKRICITSTRGCADGHTDWLLNKVILSISAPMQVAQGCALSNGAESRNSGLSGLSYTPHSTSVGDI